MNASPANDRLTALRNSLRRAHHSVLITLVACACAIAIAAEPQAAPTPGVSRFTIAAAALAVVSILTRRRQPGRPDAVRTHVGLSLTSLVAAAGVGVVGVAASIAGAPRTTAWVYVLAGAIFALRPPPGLAAAPQGESA